MIDDDLVSDSESDSELIMNHVVKNKFFMGFI